MLSLSWKVAVLPVTKKKKSSCTFKFNDYNDNSYNLKSCLSMVFFKENLILESS